MAKKEVRKELVTIKYKLDEELTLLEKDLQFEDSEDLDRQIANLKSAYKTRGEVMMIKDYDFCF